MVIRVFVIDDEASIVEAVKDCLPAAEFMVEGAIDPVRGLEALERFLPDVLLLDWNLPQKSGLELVKAIRKDDRLAGMPIVMLTVLDDARRKVEALESGADDYVTKPFDPAELAARIRAVLRRSGSGAGLGRVLEAGPLELDGGSYRVTVGGKETPVSTTEFDILYLLVASQNQPLSRQYLLEHACPETTETLRTIDVHIRHLRQKLGKAGQFIRTLHRVGYVFSINGAAAGRGPGAGRRDSV
jgi:two-component system phosphate regulon response regulator PhoB